MWFSTLKYQFFIFRKVSLVQKHDPQLNNQEVMGSILIVGLPILLYSLFAFTVLFSTYKFRI